MVINRKAIKEQEGVRVSCHEVTTTVDRHAKLAILGEPGFPANKKDIKSIP